MKLAMISDTHFGDPACSLVDDRGRTTATYARLRDVVGRGNDYLVLLGDVFDFSVAPYDQSFVKARAFFDAVRRDGLCRDIVYVPGNHDGDFWHLLQYEVTVIKRIRDGKAPVPLHQAVPGVIDDRPGSSAPGLWLPAQQLEAAAERARPGRDGVFLDRMFSSPSKDDPRFWVVYPNLYLVTDRGECILATHGHYFQTYWTAASELAMGLAADDLAPELERMGARLEADASGPYTAVEPTVGMNFPLNQLSCSGIGQAGPLTPVVRAVQQGVRNHRLSRVEWYYARLAKALERVVRLTGVERAVVRAALWAARGKLFSKLRKYEDAKADLASPTFARNFERFLLGCLREIDHVNATAPFRQNAIPTPSRVVFGHTHDPFDFRDLGLESADVATGGRGLLVANTGGWLRGEDGTVPGLVVSYETGRGLVAEPVRGDAGEQVATARVASGASARD